MSDSNWENFDVLDLADDLSEATEYKHDPETLLDIAAAMFDDDDNLLELDTDTLLYGIYDLMFDGGMSVMEAAVNSGLRDISDKAQERYGEVSIGAFERILTSDLERALTEVHKKWESKHTVRKER